MSSIVNPKTGRLIKVGGATYNKLKKSRSRRRSTSKSRRPTSRSRRRSTSRSSSSSSRSSRWSVSSPKGRERTKMISTCGSKCFLRPENKGYPVCKKGTCTIDCSGVMAAYKRARQQHDSKISNKAKSLLKRRCS